MFVDIIKKLLFSFVFFAMVSCANRTVNTKSDFGISWQYKDYVQTGYISSHHDLIAGEVLNVKVSGGRAFPYISYPIIQKDAFFIMEKNGSVKKLDHIGKVIWKSEVIDEKNDYLNGGMLLHEGRIYATYGTNVFNCIDEKTGKLIWSIKLTETTRSYPVVFNQVVFLQTVNNGLYSVDMKKGDILWHILGGKNLINTLDVKSPLIYKGDIVTQNSDGEIVFVSMLDGSENSRYKVRDNLFTLQLDNVENIYYQPLIKDNDIYFYSADLYLNKLDLTDKRLVWRKKYGISMPISLYEGRIIAIDESNNLICVNSGNGSVLWKVNLSNFEKQRHKKHHVYWNIPTIYKDMLYILSSKGDVMAFDVKSGKMISKKNIGVGGYVPIISSLKNSFVIS